MRDFQRSKCYQWESDTLWYSKFNWGCDTLQECHTFIEKIWLKEHRKFFTKDRPVPRLGDGRGRRSAVSLGGEIRLPRFARTGVLMCHEGAHELTPGDAHTEDWVSTHLYLLHTNLNIPMKQLVSTIEAYKIKYNQSMLRGLHDNTF